ncbi:hypothetical protein NHQ30_009714 [Ciborinia camelliae]|nr:hypothetical protein NHQ30_009714 [Ciborinia camelliae]
MFPLPSISYRDEPHSPYWGTINSQTNFCEEDHIITTYIAEFINTLTNITYIYYAYKGIRANSNRQDAILRNLPYLGLALVGLLSGLFHATCKDWTQWGIEIAFVGIKTRSIINLRVADLTVQKQVKKLVTYGGGMSTYPTPYTVIFPSSLTHLAVIFVSGFLIWNIDNGFCASLTDIKRSIGMPWSFILELHGWWHIFTGIGAYIFIALVEYLTSEEAGQALGPSFAWPVGLILAGTKSDASDYGNANGKKNA